MSEVYILTSEVNAYDQYGEYFCAVFLEKPSLFQLKKLLGEHWPEEQINHILNGGGRVKSENYWYNLRTVKPGELYECEN